MNIISELSGPKFRKQISWGHEIFKILFINLGSFINDDKFKCIKSVKNICIFNSKKLWKHDFCLNIKMPEFQDKLTIIFRI